MLFDFCRFAHIFSFFIRKPRIFSRFFCKSIPFLKGISPFSLPFFTSCPPNCTIPTKSSILREPSSFIDFGRINRLKILRRHSAGGAAQKCRLPKIFDFAEALPFHNKKTAPRSGLSMAYALTLFFFLPRINRMAKRPAATSRRQEDRRMVPTVPMRV